MPAATLSAAIEQHPAICRRFEAIVFDWDCTVTLDRESDAGRLRRLVELASTLGLDLAIVSNARVGDVDGQLAARPSGPGGLIMALNRGAEVFAVDRHGPQVVFRRAATMAEDASREAGLAAPRVTGDTKHVEIGLADMSDSRRWIMDWLWRRGIAPEQTLVVGDRLGPIRGIPGSAPLLLPGDGARATAVSVGVEPGAVPDGVVWLGGGPGAFLALLEDQIARRERGELPIAAEDPRWVLMIEDTDPLLERVHESLLTLADGRLGTRGSVITQHPGGDEAVLMSGIYTRTGSETHLLSAPRWNAFADGAGGPVRRILDLHAGLLHQQLDTADGPLDAAMFSSLARPATAVLRAAGRGAAPIGRALESPPGLSADQGESGGCAWMRVRGRPGSIVVALHDEPHGAGSGGVLDRVATYDGVQRGSADERAALDGLQAACSVGFDALLAEHRRAWASRWEDADAVIDGDPELQLAIRFALFHLIANVPDQGEAAVGARGVTGRGYRGHVFWDSDVFVLPFLAATHPQAARAMLEYRVRRLPAALRAARAQGRAGARFPWESARTGEDVTPRHAPDRRGEPVPILTGELEEHIVADVAWAAACYIDWADDREFALGPGRELLVQTARWWASRIERDEHGHGHIRGVIGPDEYHERVDDNAYTNVMARWNLRRAAAAAGNAIDDGERRSWLELAETIVDGYDPQTGIYEQFAGFHELEPLRIADLTPRRPVAADVLLGRERTRGAQVVKQADVLMLHYLVPDEVAAGSLAPNLEFYDPRTAHGSTLSPGVHAALLARDRRLEQALQTLRLTARIDLDDTGDMTAGGLHLAAMGSVWRALAFGFAGLRPAGDALAVDPVLPPSWQSLELHVRFHGSRVRVRIRPGELHLAAESPLNVVTPTGERVSLTHGDQVFELAPRCDRRSR